VTYSWTDPTASQEFRPEWDVCRDSVGRPITLTADQVKAIWQAIDVVEQVRRSEGFESLWRNPHANLLKSRLLGRMLVDGLPPTRTKPPTLGAGPDWSALPGGDPFS
jgi:hypothetical protein